MTTKRCAKVWYHVYTYTYTYIQYITLHYITSHYVTLHYITPLHYSTLHTSTLHTYIPTHVHTYIPTYLPAYIETCIHTHIACTKGGVKRYRQTDRQADRQTDRNTCMDDHGCMQALCHACTYTQGRIHRHMYIEHACQHGLDGIVGRLNGTFFPQLLIVLWVQGGEPSNWHAELVWN